MEEGEPLVISPNSRRDRHALLSTSDALLTRKANIIQPVSKETATFTNFERRDNTMKTRGNEGDI
jgi:hypothetical protein